MVAVNVSLTVSTGYINTFEERKVVDKTYEMQKRNASRVFLNDIIYYLKRADRFCSLQTEMVRQGFY